MEVNGKSYIPPLVSGNKFKEHVDLHKTLNETNLDVGGYLRISTAKDSQKTSIENQKKYIKEWAEFNKHHIVRFYTDIKSGAYTYLRNEMRELREDIKNGKVKGIITKEISRTSRDIMDILELKRSLADYGAFLISIKEGYDSRTDDDEFLLVIHAGLAQKERKTTSSRVKITQMIKAKEGKTNVPSPAYGYKLTADKQYLEIDTEKAKVYRQIVDKFLEGWGQLKINQWLNEQGFTTKRGGKWNTNSVKVILTNPVYLGVTIYNATTQVRDSQGKCRRVVRPQEEWIIRENTHEPLISKEKYDRIQEMIHERKERDTKEWSCEKKYLLSGLLFCDVCKGKVFGCKTVRKNVKSDPYVFYSYVDQNRYGMCNTKTKYWNMQKVDSLIMEAIKKFFSDKKLLEERIRAKQYLYNEDPVDERDKREKLMEELNKVNHSIRRQQEAYENDAVSIEEYKNRLNELRDQKKDINLKIQKSNLTLNKAGNAEKRYHEIRNRVSVIIENIDQLDKSTKEALLKKMIKRIYIKEDYSIKIEFNFHES